MELNLLCVYFDSCITRLASLKIPHPPPTTFFVAFSVSETCKSVESLTGKEKK